MDLDEAGGLLILVGIFVLICAGDPATSWRWAIAAGSVLVGALLIVLDRLTRRPRQPRP